MMFPPQLVAAQFTLVDAVSAQQGRAGVAFLLASASQLCLTLARADFLSKSQLCWYTPKEVGSLKPEALFPQTVDLAPTLSDCEDLVIETGDSHDRVTPLSAQKASVASALTRGLMGTRHMVGKGLSNCL
jgi:hypothetical protein